MALDPAALRDREFLAGCDFVEAVCWLGARLAEALAYAHSLGVLHRDIKPANVLLNQYGRPMLADFNIATVASGAGGKEGSLGGTLAYMAPEHLDAFMLRDAAAGDAVKEPADIYSLGLVLFELLCGCRPFVCHDVPTGGTSATLRWRMSVVWGRRRYRPRLTYPDRLPPCSATAWTRRRHGVTSRPNSSPAPWTAAGSCAA